MKVTARITSSGQEAAMTISKDKSRLTEEQIEAMIKDTDDYADEDGKAVERIKSRNELDKFAKEAKRKMGKIAGKIAEDEKKTVEGYLHEVTTLINIVDLDKEKLDDKLTEIKQPVNNILDKYDENEAEDEEDEDDEDFEM